MSLVSSILIAYYCGLTTIRQDSADSERLLASDGVHPEAAGQELYVQVSMEAIAKAQK